MAATQGEVEAIHIRRGGDPLSPRLDLDQLRSERLPHLRFPNDVTGYITTTYDDFRAVLGDPRFHAKRFVGEPAPAKLSVEVPDMPGFIPGMNGPEHLRIRRLAAADFSVKAIDRLRPFITAVVTRYLDRMAEMTPPVDLIEAFCLPVPSDVIGHILGVPPENSEDFQTAANETIGGRKEGLDDPDAAARAVARLHEILGEVITSKRRDPGDDLISRLTQVTDPGLSDTEIKGLCTNLLLAGHDTTAANTSLAVTLLLQNPEQLRRFRTEPDRLVESVEQIIKFNNIISDSGAAIPRLVTEDLTFAGQQLRKGDWVLPSVATANTDPAVCPYAEGLDVEGDPGQHVTFGFGAHTCLGQHLARAEMQIMLSELLNRFSTLELVERPEDLRWNDESFVYRMATLPVRW
jgi:cytochrome P450